MASYFRYVPNLEYVNRLPDSKSSSEYILVKNLFKRGKLKEDIFEDLTFFTKYKIVGDDRPDNVAFEVYNDETLDWIVLLSNNILNVQNEWPLEHTSYDNYLLNKYGSYEIIRQPHHYETIEVKNSSGSILLPKGLQVDENYSFEYFDYRLNQYVIASNITTTITNLDYENKIEDAKRNIFLLKQEYVNLIMNDMEEIMKYKQGSTQFISRTQTQGENIRLYDACD